MQILFVVCFSTNTKWIACSIPHIVMIFRKIQNMTFQKIHRSTRKIRDKNKQLWAYVKRNYTKSQLCVRNRFKSQLYKQPPIKNWYSTTNKKIKKATERSGHACRIQIWHFDWRHQNSWRKLWLMCQFNNVSIVRYANYV